ncbi:unnamed protein product [Nezara viridula]|nr:unnamed protein product [Nezara viridula]
MIFRLLLLFYVFPIFLQECIIVDKPFECDDMIQILEYHNDLRSKVAQGRTKLFEAKDMWALKWDDALAVMAQDWANKCTLKPNTGRPNDCGENIAWLSLTEVQPIDVEAIIEMWYDEINKFDPEIKGIQGGTEHFTQLIWGETQFIGCGSTIFQDKEDSKVYQALVVCNYKPA